MDEQLHEQIAFYLYRERVMNMGVFDAWFSKEALEKRTQEPPTEAEQLAAQHRSDVLEHLTNFASVWPRPEFVEGLDGVISAGVKEVGERPPSMLSEYRAAEQQKSMVNVSGSFGNVLMDDNSGNVTFSLSVTHQQFTMAGAIFQEFLAALQSLPRVAVPSAGVAPGYGPQVAGNNALPARKSQTEMVAEQTGAARENAERAQYSVKMQLESGIWGSKRGDK